MTKHRKIITPELHMRLSLTPGWYSEYNARGNRRTTPGGLWAKPAETQDESVKRLMRGIKSAQTSGTKYASDFPHFYKGMKTRDYVCLYLCGRLYDPEEETPFDLLHLDMTRLGERAAPYEQPELEMAA